MMKTTDTNEFLNSFGTNEEELELAKALSKVNQYLANETEQGTNVGFEYDGKFISNVFTDEIGWFELTLEESVNKYGMDNVRTFYFNVLNDLNIWAEAEKQIVQYEWRS